ncbi:MAG: tetratricopeptide repeat protein [Proteobacteria bacterium]|nr:tetratricopeptide repeat protein [Pseudomonadota bacterium]
MPIALKVRRSDMVARGPIGLTRGMVMAAVVLAPVVTGLAGCQTPAIDAPHGSASLSQPMPVSIAGSYLVARQAYKLRDLGHAASYFEVALNEDPENQALIKRTFLTELEYGSVPAAVTLAERGVKGGAPAPFMLLTLALNQAKAGNWAAAEDFLLRLPQSRLNQILRPLLAGWVAVGQADWSGARKSFAMVEALSGFEVLALLHSGQAARLEGDLTTADTAFQSALEKSGSPPLRLSLAAALFYASTQRPEKSGQVLAKRSERDYDALGVAAVLKRATAGQPVPGLVGSASDGMAEALFDIASALQRERGNNAAMIMAQLALYMRPGFPLAQLLVGEILDDRRHHQAALNIYRRISTESAYHSMAQLRAASSLQDLERIEESIALLKGLANRRSTDPTPWTRIGDMQRTAKRWSAAIDAYDLAVARIGSVQARDWTLFYTRGIALERTQNWKRAEADFLKALELAPNQPYVMNYLGYSWTEQGINLKQAEGMIQKAVNLRPEDGYIIDSLGWILYRTGRFMEAVPKLERAVQLRPNDPTINDHLGDAYWRVDRRIEARFQWRRALSMDPEPELVSEIESKLKQGLPPPVILREHSKKVGIRRVPDA